jgi:ADP-ribosylglycohydrolase
MMVAQKYDKRDRILGAYFGSASGDALGGPVEGWHAQMIKAVHKRVDHFLPYTGKLHPGYALVADPGAITDDTFIKDDFASFVLAHPDEKDRTPENLVKHLLKYAHFDCWYWPDVVPLRFLEEGGTIEESRVIRVGGGAAWWTSFGLIHAGDPQKAFDETCRLSIIWKQPFEQNIIAAVQAGVAASVIEGATVDTVCDTVLNYAGPLAKKLLLRAKQIAEKNAGDLDGMIQELYAEALVEECTNELDGPMPKKAVALNPYRGATVLWAEQIPLAFAALIFGKGNFLDTMIACINIGRDSDSIGSSCGSWIGGLVGYSGMPQDWVETMQRVNLGHINLTERALKLAVLAGA